MTDRIAALAEAISRDLFDGREGGEWYGSAEDMAAAVLAALPEGWCGHTARPESVRDALDRMGLPQTTGRIPPEIVHPAPFVDDFGLPVTAEIARLRKIEVAARAVADKAWTHAGEEDREIVTAVLMDALRDALDGSERAATDGYSADGGNLDECPVCHRVIVNDAHGGPHPSPGDHDPGEHVLAAYGRRP